MKRSRSCLLGTATLLASTFALTSCSVVLGIESDRYALTDEQDGGFGPLPSNWTCINDPVPELASEPVSVTFLFSDAAGNQTSSTFAGTPIADVEVKACALIDFECEAPIATVIGDSNGRVTLTLPVGFNGFYEVRPPQGYPPYLIKRSIQRYTERIVHPLVSSAFLTLGARLAQTTQDPNLGMAFIAALDCDSLPAPGIQFAIANMTDSERLAYARERLIDPSATFTDATGAALAFNVPPGTLSVASSLADTQRPIGQFSALVRPGWVTFLHTRLEQATAQVDDPQ